MSTTTLQMTYGDRIRRARLAQGLTQEEFAREVGSTQGIISNHEKLDRPPLRNTRALPLMIQLRYGLDADWLLYGDVPPQRAAADVTRDNRTARPVLALVRELVAA